MSQTPQTVPFLDLKAINARHAAALQQATERVLRSGWYIGGQEVQTFEHAFAHSCGVRHCVGTGNGLDALTLILRAWLAEGRLQPGDQVLVPANSFIASALAVTASGLTLQLADPDPQTFNLSARQAADALTPQTKVIMAVHLYGQLADVAGLRALCRQRGLLLLEDAAQAHGAHLKGQQVGSWGDAAAFSFYPGKNLGALGDGGAVVSQDADLIRRVRQLGNYGSEIKYQHDLQGVNSRLDPIQAAFLQERLLYLDQDNARRRQIASAYWHGIRNPYLQLPKPPEQTSTHVWHIFAVRSPHRHALQQYLAERGIATGIHYPIPIHRQAAYPDLSHLSFPVSEQLAAEQLSLPISPVQSDRQTCQVIEAVNRFVPERVPENAVGDTP